MNKLKKFGIIAALPLVFLMTGCAVQGSVTPDPHASVATTKHVVPEPLLKGFGDVITYTDGVSVSVSKPTGYSPSAEAAGMIDGNVNVEVTVVVTNNSKVTLDQVGYPAANSGGEKASVIVDMGANVGNTPSGPLLAGQSIKWVEAFSVVNPDDMTLSYAPNLDYKLAIFDSKH